MKDCRMTKTAHGVALRPGALTVLVTCLVFLAAAAAAQDWPSWRGRAQTGVSDQTGLVCDGRHDYPAGY